MAITMTLDKHDFAAQFKAYGREDQFSPEGLDILFDFINESGDVELDVIGICCDYVESNTDDIIKDYDIDTAEDSDCIDKENAVREYLWENTIICGETEDGFVFIAF